MTPINTNSSIKNLMRELPISTTTTPLSPLYPSQFQTARSDANGSSTAKRQQKSSMPLVIQLVSPNLAVQIYTKSNRLPIWVSGSSLNTTSNQEISSSPNAHCSS